MSKDLQSKPVSTILETAAKRPIPGSNVSVIMDQIKALLKSVTSIALHKHEEAGGYSPDLLMDEIAWHIERWNVLEHNLCYITNQLTTPEVDDILRARQEALLWLFNEKSTSNQEIIELCKNSNNQRFTDTINFQIPFGYKGGKSTLLMEAALQAINTYERSYGPYVPEPEYLIEKNQEDGTTRRFINLEWIDWWCNYSDRNQHPIRVAEDRVRESFSDRKLKHLDVRTKEVTDPEVLGDPRLHREIFVTYVASL